jgi:hypothetical protein
MSKQPPAMRIMAGGLLFVANAHKQGVLSENMAVSIDKGDEMWYNER